MFGLRLLRFVRDGASYPMDINMRRHWTFLSAKDSVDTYDTGLDAGKAELLVELVSRNQ
jgi:hypothetical protein